MKPPAPVSNIVLPVIAFATGFPCNQSLPTAARYTSNAYDSVGIHRRTEASVGARCATVYLVKAKRGSSEATSRHQAAVEQARVAQGGTRYGLLLARLGAKWFARRHEESCQTNLLNHPPEV